MFKFFFYDSEVNLLYMFFVDTTQACSVCHNKDFFSYSTGVLIEQIYSETG